MFVCGISSVVLSPVNHTQPRAGFQCVEPLYTETPLFTKSEREREREGKERERYRNIEIERERGKRERKKDRDIEIDR